VFGGNALMVNIKITIGILIIPINIIFNVQSVSEKEVKVFYRRKSENIAII
jgi:hypothetical protein